jgi:DNA-binding NarL/FixJ family response regulator
VLNQGVARASRGIAWQPAVSSKQQVLERAPWPGSGLWRWARLLVARRVQPLVFSGAVAGLLLAGGIAWFADARFTDLLLEQVSQRAIDHAALGTVDRVTAADFAPPYTRERITSLDRRLDPTLDSVRRKGSGILRLNLFAPDGTLIYSDLDDLTGRVIDPESEPLLARALIGEVSAEVSDLLDADNHDLKQLHGEALEAHVPLVVEGQIVAAYEIYVDPAPLHAIRGLLLGAVVTSLLVIATLGVWAAHRTRRLRPATAVFAVAETRPVAVAHNLSTLTSRELDVLELVARGLSNRQIAAELVIGERTVETHVSRVLGKLGMTSRLEVALSGVGREPGAGHTRNSTSEAGPNSRTRHAKVARAGRN